MNAEVHSQRLESHAVPAHRAQFIDLFKGQFRAWDVLTDAPARGSNADWFHSHLPLFIMYQELATVPALPNSEEEKAASGLMLSALARFMMASFWKFTPCVR